MKLLPKKQYNEIENMLKQNTTNILTTEQFKSAINEIITFFDVPIYKEFLELFYFKRYQYKNRYPDNRSMLQYLCQKLYVQEPTLYIIRKEIVYKAAMIFYKYQIIKED